jgi:hypothetical protein
VRFFGFGAGVVATRCTAVVSLGERVVPEACGSRASAARRFFGSRFSTRGFASLRTAGFGSGSSAVATQ